MTKQCFDEFHRLFGIRYPFGDYHQAFVPEFNAGAMENPGCVTFRDPLVFSSRVTRGDADQARHHGRARDGAPVVRQHRHPEVVGRPVAQRVVRRVHGQPGHRRRHGVRRRVDRTTPTPGASGGSTPTSARAPTRSPATAPSTRPPRCRTSTASPTPRARASSSSSTPRSATRCSSPGRSTTSPGTASATRPCTTSSLSWETAGAGDLSAFTTQLAAHRRAGHDRARPRGRRAPAYAAGRAPRRPVAHVPGRDRGPRSGLDAPQSVTVVGAETDIDVPAGAAVVLDPYEDTWALVEPDPVTVATLEAPAARRPRTPACAPASGTTCAAPSTTPRSTRRTCSTCSRRACRSRTPTTPSPYTMPWAIGRPWRRSRPTRTPRCGGCTRLAWLDARAVRAGLRPPARRLPGGDQLRRPTPACCGPGSRAGPPARHRPRPRPALAGAGPAGHARRDRPRRAATTPSTQEPTGQSRVEHTRATASLPDEEAKAWAWQRFTGEVDVPNYELEAAGLGMWRVGQEHLTEPYVDRYFDELPDTVERAQRLGAGRPPPSPSSRSPR